MKKITKLKSDINVINSQLNQLLVSDHFTNDDRAILEGRYRSRLAIKKNELAKQLKQTNNVTNRAKNIEVIESIQL